jgi:hypothetical protein
MLLDLQVELICNEHNNVFVNSKQRLEGISAIVIGRELKKYAQLIRHFLKGERNLAETYEPKVKTASL